MPSLKALCTLAQDSDAENGDTAALHEGQALMGHLAGCHILLAACTPGLCV